MAENVDIAPGFINSKYECLRPTPYEPKFNRKLVSLLLLLERKRQIDNEPKRALSYRHAISAIKVNKKLRNENCPKLDFCRPILEKYNHQRKQKKSLVNYYACEMNRLT